MKLLKKTKNIIVRIEPDFKQYIVCSDVDYYLKDKNYVKTIFKPTIESIRNSFLFITNKGLYDSEFLGFDSFEKFIVYCDINYNVTPKDIGYILN
jgi:hypothetical protein